MSGKPVNTVAHQTKVVRLQLATAFAKLQSQLEDWDKREVNELQDFEKYTSNLDESARIGFESESTTRHASILATYLKMNALQHRMLGMDIRLLLTFSEKALDSILDLSEIVSSYPTDEEALSKRMAKFQKQIATLKSGLGREIQVPAAIQRELQEWASEREAAKKAQREYIK